MKLIPVVYYGLHAYDEASKKFFTLRAPRVQNVRSVGLRSSFNQIVKRLQRTIREGEGDEDYIGRRISEYNA